MEHRNHLTELQKALENAKYPVALTGAGISAPSGIPTFDMKWKGQDVRDFLTREYFTNNPLEFYELFREIVQWRDKDPNLAHLALAHYNVSIITQNIDGLHHKAASKKVIEIHGDCENLICRECGNTVSTSLLLAEPQTPLSETVHCLKCNSLFDIGVVLYGDNLRDWWKATAEIAKADLLLVIGTSLQTYPANELPIMAKRNGCPVIHINDDCLRAFDFAKHLLT